MTQSAKVLLIGLDTFGARIIETWRMLFMEAKELKDLGLVTIRRQRGTCITTVRITRKGQAAVN
jgi:hypothetical protein